MRRSWWMAAGVVAWAAAVAGADELRLRNGDVLHGTLGTANATELEFTHDVGFAIKLPWAQIRGLRSEGMLTLRLQDGQIYKGQLRYGPSDDTVTIAPEGLEPVAGIAFGRLAAIGDPPPPVRWKGQLAAGGVIYDGNTRGKSALIRFNAQRKGPIDLIEARALYNYSQDDEGMLTARNGLARIQYNYNVYKRLYVYAGGTFEYDRFKFLNLRSRGGGGFGLTLLDEDWLEWRIEAGAEYTNEDLRGSPDDRFASARFATNLQWDVIPDMVRFTEIFEFQPSFEDGHDFTFRSESTLSIKLFAGVGLGIAVITDYDEKPPAGAKHRTDTKYTGTVTWTF